MTTTPIFRPRRLGARALLMLQILCDRMGEWVTTTETSARGLPHHRSYVRKIRALGYAVQSRKRRWRNRLIFEYRLDPGRLARVRPERPPTQAGAAPRSLKCPACGLVFSRDSITPAEGGGNGIR